MAWTYDPGTTQLTRFDITYYGDFLRGATNTDNITMSFGPSGSGLTVATYTTHTDILWKGVPIGTLNYPNITNISGNTFSVSVDTTGAVKVIYPPMGSTLTAQIPGTQWQTQDNTANTFTGTAAGAANNYFQAFHPVCFVRGARLATPDGTVPVEDLRPGDAVLTADGDAQPVRWIGKRRATGAQLETFPKLRPVRIRRGALGPDLPARDLLVSRQHRMVLRSAIVQRMFGVPEVLVPAKDLLGLDGVEIAAEVDGVEYWHILLDAHHVVIAEGACAESLHPGPQAIRALGPATAAQLAALRPDLCDGPEPPLARPEVKGAQARRCIERHVGNGKPVHDPAVMADAPGAARRSA